MTQPNYNSQGQQVWDPAVGLYFKPAAENAESFGGIVGALQDQMVAQGEDPLAYPYNFAGIISAIQDLTITAQAGPASVIGTNPGGGFVYVDPDGKPQWEYTKNPTDGELWFDTRQGRLLVAYQNEWYQTNGADGVPIVTATSTAPSVTNLVIGQLWWTADTDDLYIFEGQWTQPNGTVYTTETPAAGDTPVWIKITLDQDDYFQTTANLPLSDDFKDELALVPAGEYLPIAVPSTTEFQQQANEYFLDCLESLNTELVKQTITISTTPPDNPAEGQLWFDSDDIDMSIWYVAPDETAGQWVPITATYVFAESIGELEQKLDAEADSRETADQTLADRLDATELATTSNSQAIAALQGDVTTLNARSVDLSPYALQSRMDTHLFNLQTQINGLTSSVYNHAPYATDTELAAAVALINTSLSSKATTSDLAAVQALIPSLDGLASSSYVDEQVAASAGLPTSGGSLTGALSFNTLNSGIAKLDFSANAVEGIESLKYRTHSSDGGGTVSFGTNDQENEYAWDFSGNEDFCWKSSQGKVASIDQTGLAATEMFLAGFTSNTASGRTLVNRIDVRERLNKTQTALEALRQAANSATDFASLKAAMISALQDI